MAPGSPGTPWVARIGRHPGVREVAVIGVPDEKWGERVMAVVVRAEGATVSADELRRWTRERIAHYKAPAEVRLAEELPRTATGKLFKRELRQTLGGADAAVSR